MRGTKPVDTSPKGLTLYKAQCFDCGRFEVEGGEFFTTNRVVANGRPSTVITTAVAICPSCTLIAQARLEGFVAATEHPYYRALKAQAAIKESFE